MTTCKFFSTILFVAIILLINCTLGFSQTMQYYRKAFDILEKSRLAMGSTPSGLVISAHGSIYNLGHYEIPEQTKELPLEETYGFFPKENVLYLGSEMQDRNKKYQRYAVSKIDSLYAKDYHDRFFSKSISQEFAFEMSKVIPTQLLQFVYENRASLRYLGEQSTFYLLSFSYAPSQSATLHIHKQTYMLEKVEILTYSPIYGDGTYETFYENFIDRNGTKIPTTRLEYEFGLLERKLSYTEVHIRMRPDSTNLKMKGVPEYFIQNLVDSVQVEEQFEFEAITPEIDLIKITSQNNKVLVAKFKNHIALFEAPQGVDLNRQLMAELQKRYLGRPLRYLFVTHHHPDHAGGIRNYTNQPVTIITTKGNLEYFEKLFNTRHSIGSGLFVNDSIQAKIDFVPISTHRNFKDQSNEVIAYEIGSQTSHTNEHLVYYFPKSKILWTGDLLFFDKKGTLYNAGARGKSILDLIVGKKIKVEKIYTSWPLHGQKDYETVDFLKKLVVNH